MITKAEVVAIVEDTNLFKVRIPIFNDSLTLPTENFPTATLCTLPGVDNPISVGDIVYVAFEDNDIGKPVILGQLYGVNKNSKTRVNLKVGSLEVEDTRDKGSSNVKLPENTTIGNITTEDINNLILEIKNK